ncbi:MAG TPA: tetratricopeptide repeat protein, partial [Pyrinomonadaceae bacterium]|nr:tetratricopeptide repeat protein [Pyrinomonadaceae bacterium]
MFRALNLSLLVVSVFLVVACDDNVETKGLPAGAPPEPVAQSPAPAHNNQSILFYENRIKNDPDDYIAHNRLASEYLGQMRLTGDTAYLELALKTAQASLAILPAEQNVGGLAALAAAEFSLHQFVAARDHARRLTELEPNRGYAYQVLADALLELGEYDEARTVLAKMEDLGGFQLMAEVAIEARLSHHAELYGNTDKATRHMKKALDLLKESPGPGSETKAWVEWQLGRISLGK